MNIKNFYKEDDTMSYKDTIGLLKSLQIMNDVLNNPEKMHDVFQEVMIAIEKGATATPDKNEQ